MADVTDELLDASAALVLHCARIVRAARQASTAPVAQMRVLSILDEHGALRISALAEIDRCSQPTMTGTVALLLAQGDVTKTVDPSDARASLVQLTDVGRGRLASLRHEYAEALAARIADGATVSPDQLRAAVEVLAAVLDSPRFPHPQEGPA